MFRLLSILAFGALSIFPDRASADPLWSRESLTSATISRQRIIYHRRYRSAYLTIGYDPLPYRFGTSTIWGPPYRYYW